MLAAGATRRGVIAVLARPAPLALAVIFRCAARSVASVQACAVLTTGRRAAWRKRARVTLLTTLLTPKSFVAWLTRTGERVYSVGARPEFTARIAGTLINVLAAARPCKSLLAVARTASKATPILAAVQAVAAITHEPGHASATVATLPRLGELCMRFTKLADDISGVEACASVLARVGVALIAICARLAFPSCIAVTGTV